MSRVLFVKRVGTQKSAVCIKQMHTLREGVLLPTKDMGPDIAEGNTIVPTCPQP